nr:hypothetical protein [Verrucomicrobium spinosum]
MSLLADHNLFETRRQFFARGKNALGYAALTSLLGEGLARQAAASSSGAASGWGRTSRPRPSA